LEPIALNVKTNERALFMKKTVMVVDDEQNIREAVKILLEDAGFNVLTAVDGDDCLKKLDQQKTDLVLMDIFMPGTPVDKIVKKITKTKVVYLSVCRASEVKEKELLKPKQVIGFIQKPFELDELLNTVQDYIKDHKTQ
tara:strand:+ start:121 stop:537 length:417 start_codon:yes stop_codon:yes gene_type:complete